MDNSTNMIKEDIIVSKVVNDPAKEKEVLMIFGFTGKSTQDGHLRLYLNPQLDDFVDIPTDIIYNSMEVPPPLSYFGGSLLWINKNSDILHRNNQNEVFKADFLNGRKINGKPEGTYADVLKNIYMSSVNEKGNTDINEMQNQSNLQNDFNNFFYKMLGNIFTMYSQNTANQQSQPNADEINNQSQQQFGIPANSFTLISPTVSSNGFVQHMGVNIPSRQNNSYQAMQPQMIYTHGDQVKQQFNNQLNAVNIPGIDKFPPIPANLLKKV